MKFFRGIRQRNLLNNKFSKYLLYAIGEIVLVIIGILFALYINNQNELSKKEANAEILFTNILKELKSDIEESTVLIDFYRKKDSLSHLVTLGGLTVEDYQKSGTNELIYVADNYETYKTTQHGYDALIRDLEDVPAKFNEAIDIMNELYKESKTTITVFNKSIHDHVLNNNEKLAATYDWYSSVNPAGRINYAVNSPKYKNQVTIYKMHIFSNLLPAIKRYRLKAIEAYNHIADVLDVPVNEEVFNLNQHFPKSYLGYYYNEASQSLIKIFPKNGNISIFYTQNNSNDLIYPYRDTTFYNIRNMIYSFETVGTDKIIHRSYLSFYTKYIQIDSTEIASLSNQNYEEIEVSAIQSQKYVGQYKLSPELILKVFKEGAKMKAQATGQGVVDDFIFIAENVLYSKKVKVKLTFNENKNGAIESLILMQGGMNVPAKRIEN